MAENEEAGMLNGIAPNLSHLAEAIKLVRTYNGKTNVTDWLIKFKTDLLAFSIPFKYAIVSLDRFLVDDALNWWNSVSHNYETNDLDKSEAEFREIWTEITRDMKVFFNSEALLQAHKKQNKVIVYKVGDDPQAYVTSKLAILKQINEKMDDKEKVRNLLRGLPTDIRLDFSAQDIESVSSFLNRLRKYAEILDERKPKEKPKEKSFPSTSADPHSFRALDNVQVKNQSPPRLCFQCNQPGHVKRDCPRNRNEARNFNTAVVPGSRTPQRGFPFRNNFRGRGRGFQPQPHFYNPYQNPFYSPMAMQSPFHFGQPNYFSRGPQPLMNFPPNPPNHPQNHTPQNLLRITEVNEQPPQLPSNSQGNE